MAVNPARKRYKRRTLLVTLLYLVSLFAAVLLVERGDRSDPAGWVLAVLPGIAVLGYFYAFGRLIIEQTDEFVRMLVVRQALIATAFALSLATIWGFLENFELVPHVSPFWVAIAWFVGLLVGGVYNRVTMGSWGECW